MARFPFGTTTGQVSRLRPNRAGGPIMVRGDTNQDAETPWPFIKACEEKFGPLTWDLAATKANKKAPLWVPPETDSFTLNWHQLEPGLCFLNPPYAQITPWARKCAEECQLGARILLLVPASVGANWYWDWVVPFADVYSIGRVMFDNCYDRNGDLITKSYPKDLILCHYDWRVDGCLRTGFDNTKERGAIYRWRWQ